ncbi:MAG: dihydroneopterin aldolase [Vicingaceae bacterium]
MKHQVSLENAAFHAKHGLFEEENVIGGRFEVTVHLQTNFEQASKFDDLHGTINYAAVYDLIKEEVDRPSKLIENLAQRIVDRIKAEFKKVEGIHLKVSKCNPPISGEVERVSVIIEE